MIAFTETFGGESAMSRIENRARNYTELRAELAEAVAALNEHIEEITRDNMPMIQELAERTAAQRTELEAAIAAAPQLFEKPRTMIFHGVKCGFRKNEGRIEFDDADLVVKKIHQMFAEPEPYLRVVMQPNKEALATLSGTELKRLGCRLVDSADVVIIKPADSDVDRKVSALLKAAQEPVTSGR